MREKQNAVVPNLRKFRKEAGMTQMQLAELAGVDDGTVKRVESGLNTGVDTVKSMAAALGISVSDLLGDNVTPAAESVLCSVPTVSPNGASEGDSVSVPEVPPEECR